jgi:hypothetical protein
MSRRTALGFASAVVLALLASMIAVTMRLEALRVASPPAQPTVWDTPPKPLVREVTETVTIHRTQREEADGPEQVVTVVRTIAPTVPSAATDGWSEPASDPGGEPEPEREPEKGGDEHGPKPDHDDEDVPGDKF